MYHPRFARFYEWTSAGRFSRKALDPLRREIIEQAQGLVLEIGAGTGLNFAWYDPTKVERVEALEPNAAMTAYALPRVEQARVPIHLSSGLAESLPFPAQEFDTVVMTLVFCSVENPALGFKEIMRVLKPEGKLLFVEHVRSQGRLNSWLQDRLVPLTTRLAGNCHWNRDTLHEAEQAGFSIASTHQISGGIQPVIFAEAYPPKEEKSF